MPARLNTYWASMASSFIRSLSMVCTSDAQRFNTRPAGVASNHASGAASTAATTRSWTFRDPRSDPLAMARRVRQSVPKVADAKKTYLDRCAAPDVSSSSAATQALSANACPLRSTW